MEIAKDTHLPTCISLETLKLVWTVSKWGDDPGVTLSKPGVGLPFQEGEDPLSGPLCHLVHSLQTKHYSVEDTLYQLLTPWWKQYPSTRAYTRTGL